MPVCPLSNPQPQNSGGRIKQFTSKRVKNHILRMFGQNSKRREDPVSITEWPVQPWTGCLYMSCYMNNIYLWLAKHMFIWFSVTGRRNGFLTEPWRQFHKKNSHYVSSHSRITEGMLLAKVRMACVLSCSVVSNSVMPWTSLPGSFVHGIFQARVLESAAISSYRGSSWLRDWTHVSYVSCTGIWVLYHWATSEVPRMVRALANGGKVGAVFPGGGVSFGQALFACCFL